MKKQYLLFIIIALLVSACQKEEIPSTWTISGEIVVTDAQTPAIKNPLENIKVYLLNMDCTFDTISGWYSQEDILDSATTNTNGKYSFVNIVPGNYWVFPKAENEPYIFKLSENSDSLWITEELNKSSFEINFDSPEISAENGLFDSFEFSVNNIYEGYVWRGNTKTIVVKLFQRCHNRYWNPWDGIHYGSWWWDQVDLMFWDKDDMSSSESIKISAIKDLIYKVYTDDFLIGVYESSAGIEEVTDEMNPYEKEYKLEGCTGCEAQIAKKSIYPSINKNNKVTIRWEHISTYVYYFNGVYIDLED